MKSLRYRTLDAASSLAARMTVEAYCRKKGTPGLVKNPAKKSDAPFPDARNRFCPKGVSVDGKFHQPPIAMKQSEVKVRSREGYFAATDSVENQAALEEQPSLAKNSPLDCTSLLFTVRAGKKVANKVPTVRTRVGKTSKRTEFFEIQRDPDRPCEPGGPSKN